MSVGLRTPTASSQGQGRRSLRQALVTHCGGAREAFRYLDLSGSGRVSMQEFTEGLSRLGVRWTEHTGLRQPRQVFQLMDTAHRGFLEFAELFPDEVLAAEPLQDNLEISRLLTQWCKKNTEFEPHQDPKWRPGNQQQANILGKLAKQRDEATHKRKWMEAAFKRLKGRGKSDSRCRELVALHLPKGTGPKGRDDVQYFSENDVRHIKVGYSEEVNGKVKHIQSQLYDLHHQRISLHQVNHQLRVLQASQDDHSQDDESQASQVLQGAFA